MADITDIQDLYIPSTLSIVEMVESNELSKIYGKPGDITKFLLTKIKKKYCNKCNNIGYIGDNIEIISRTMGKLNACHFNGCVYYNIKVKVYICTPFVGSNIKCIIKGKNEAGVLCEAHPFKIMLCSDIDDISELEVGENIIIEVLNYRAEINNRNIKILGRLKKYV